MNMDEEQWFYKVYTPDRKRKVRTYATEWEAKNYARKLGDEPYEIERWHTKTSVTTISKSPKN